MQMGHDLTNFEQAAELGRTKTEKQKHLRGMVIDVKVSRDGIDSRYQKERAKDELIERNKNLETHSTLNKGTNPT